MKTLLLFTTLLFALTSFALNSDLSVLPKNAKSNQTIIIGTKTATINPSTEATKDGHNSIARTTSLGAALSFDGLNDVVSTPIDFNTTTFQNWTYECWVTSPFAPVTTNGTDGPMYGANMGIIWNHNQAGYRGTAYVYTSDNYFKTNFGLLSANTWYHLAATYDGSVLSAYKNGVLTSTVAVTGTLAAATGSLIIGKHPSVAHYWEGSIDEARVWNVARTCSEINQAMNTNIPGNTPGLKAYYKFDEGVAVSTNTSITTVIDATPNANNAIASNFAMTGNSSNYVSAAPLNNPINSSCLATGLNSLSTSKSDYIIYPNPTNSILNIECENSATILIVNLLGEVVKTEIVNEISKIDVSLLKPGVYFIQDSKSGKAIKFIKE